MPIQSRSEDEAKEDGTTAPKLHVEFTNGSLQQLKELGKFFNVTDSDSDPAEVVKLAISLLQNIKDQRETPAKKD
jgi:hypothetical protein